MKKADSIRNAYALLRQSELGVLSTHSKANEGFPFGSVSTYMSTVEGDAIFYISDLAQHTKNLLTDSKMCLTVFSGAEGAKANDNDPNAGARLSLIGEATKLSSEEAEKIAPRFFKLYPDSKSYHKTHGFYFFKLKTERARFIGGFGDINWISKEKWALETPQWLEGESRMVEHMNQDHMDAMQLICKQRFNIDAKKVEMLTITPDGCFLSADAKKPLFVRFDNLAFDSQQVRQELVALTKQARAELDLKKAS